MSKTKKHCHGIPQLLSSRTFRFLSLQADIGKYQIFPAAVSIFTTAWKSALSHSHSGTMKFYSEPMSFKEGDVTLYSLEYPHTTYSESGNGKPLVLYYV